MAAVMHVEDVGVEILNQAILGPMKCTCSPCVKEVQEIVIAFVVALEHGFDEEGDWLEKGLHKDGKDARLHQRIVKWLPGCKDVKQRANSRAGVLRLKTQIYNALKSLDSVKRRAVLYALGRSCGNDKAKIDVLLATEAKALGYFLSSAPEQK